MAFVAQHRSAGGEAEVLRIDCPLVRFVGVRIDDLIILAGGDMPHVLREKRWGGVRGQRCAGPCGGVMRETRPSGCYGTKPSHRLRAMDRGGSRSAPRKRSVQRRRHPVLCG